MPQEFYSEDVTAGRLNTYEAVILASQEARRINQMRMMVDQAEGEEKVTTTAMRRLAERKIEVKYGDGEETEDPQDDASTGQTDSAGR